MASSNNPSTGLKTSDMEIACWSISCNYCLVALPMPIPASKLYIEGEIRKFLTIFAEKVIIHSVLLHKGRVLWHSWEGDLLTLAAKDSETRSARVSS